MKKYIVYVRSTECSLFVESFNEAEKLAFSLVKDGFKENDLFIGKLSHKLHRIDSHLESIFIDNTSAKDGYVPQVGDVFAKIKNYNNKDRPELIFERTIMRVNPDSVVIQNTGSKDLQAMPTYQWLRWIRGAEFKKRAGAEL